jgi:hypothetical protein
MNIKCIFFLIKTKKFKNKVIAGTDRSSLLDDIFSLADGGYVYYEQALEFALYLSTEDDYIAWSTASSKLLKLLPLIKTRGAYLDFKVTRIHILKYNIVMHSNFFQDYTESLVKNQYTASGWVENPGDSHIDQ